MTVKEFVTDTKFIIAFIVTVLGGLTALGATIDRPAWHSELAPLIEVSGNNEKRIIQMQIDDVQRRVWDHKDRYKMTPNIDLRRRIQEMEQHKKNLEDEKKEIQKNLKGD